MNYLSVLLQATLAGSLALLFRPASPTVDPPKTNDNDNRDGLLTPLRREFEIFPRLNESYEPNRTTFQNSK